MVATRDAVKGRRDLDANELRRLMPARGAREEQVGVGTGGDVMTRKGYATDLGEDEEGAVVERNEKQGHEEARPGFRCE